jgi:hypothetical protein
VGRLGPGAGSTPSITDCKGRRLIVITDGALPMNVMWYDAETGKLAGQRKVQFAKNEAGNLPTTSEQSVAVDGCRAFVVQNYMGEESLDDDVFCTTAPQQSGVVRAQIPEICKQLLPSNSTDLFISRACPPALGCYSLGAAVYEIDPEAKEAGTGLNKVSRFVRGSVSVGTRGIGGGVGGWSSGWLFGWSGEPLSVGLLVCLIQRVCMHPLTVYDLSPWTTDQSMKMLTGDSQLGARRRELRDQHPPHLQGTRIHQYRRKNKKRGGGRLSSVCLSIQSPCQPAYPCTQDAMCV